MIVLMGWSVIERWRAVLAVREIVFMVVAPNFAVQSMALYEAR
jgi:hypothetical protein